MSAFSKEYAEALAQASGHVICITDRDQVIAAAGGMRKEYIGKPISRQLETAINDREQILSSGDDSKYVKVTGEESEESLPQVVCPILCEGDAIGAVILIGKDAKRRMGETEQVLARCAAGFMGRQMEQ